MSTTATKPTPREILAKVINTHVATGALAPNVADAVQAQSEEVQQKLGLPAIVALGDLATPPPVNDPTELIKRRFLSRGAVALLVGPTGVGKSSLLMQIAVYLSVGKSLFGIQPGDVFTENGMRILLVQAENDSGDLAEMRDGVFRGCEDLSPEEKQLASERILTLSCSDKTSDTFAHMLRSVIDQNGPFDMVFIDPAFSFLGADANSNKDVSHFLRNLLTPIAQEYQFGLLIAHHTNKPLRGKEKDSWQAGDFSYLGAGSAEWANAPRAILAIRSLGSHSVFEFVAAKRGKRLGWKDGNGESTHTMHIAHHGAPGVICWRPATPEEVTSAMAGLPSSGGKKAPACTELSVVHLVQQCPGRAKKDYTETLGKTFGLERTTTQNRIRDAIFKGLIQDADASSTDGKDGRVRTLTLTKKGRDLADANEAVHDWAEIMDGLPGFRG